MGIINDVSRLGLTAVVVYKQYYDVGQQSTWLETVHAYPKYSSLFTNTSVALGLILALYLHAVISLSFSLVLSIRGRLALDTHVC